MKLTGFRHHYDVAFLRNDDEERLGWYIDPDDENATHIYLMFLHIVISRIRE